MASLARAGVYPMHARETRVGRPGEERLKMHPYGARMCILHAPANGFSRVRARSDASKVEGAPPYGHGPVAAKSARVCARERCLGRGKAHHKRSFGFEILCRFGSSLVAFSLDPTFSKSAQSKQSWTSHISGEVELKNRPGNDRENQIAMDKRNATMQRSADVIARSAPRPPLRPRARPFA